MSDGGEALHWDELLEHGGPDFVDELRSVADTEALGWFAARWHASPAPNARRLLLEYLERPLNAFRHEALVKRLFKLAEKAGDDAVMARFLVGLDRSIRRAVTTTRHWETYRAKNSEQAERMAEFWRLQGFLSVRAWQTPRTGGWIVNGTRSDPYITTPAGSTLPKDPNAVRRDRQRLFSLRTRKYLRRRAWRYFRAMGKTGPARYVAAISEALSLYEDADVGSGLALIDNWGLVHALFHHSPVLNPHPNGWRVVEGRSLAELAPAPIYEDAWRSAPRALFDLMVGARCRPVRQWAVRLLRTGTDEALNGVAGAEEWIDLLGHEEPEIAAFAAERLAAFPDLSEIRVERWLAAAERAHPDSMATLAELMERRIAPDRVPIADVLRLAASRPLPMARLGLNWLKGRTSSAAIERSSVLALLEAECGPVRPEILQWLRSRLASEPDQTAESVLELLDCRHADARAEGLDWFRSDSKARDDAELWKRLMESPHDDVRLALVADLDERLRQAGTNDGSDRALDFDPTRALDAERLRLLWATVLLNVQRGGRAKPRAVDQIARRLARRPDEAEQLLPLLRVGLRSVRAPERRSALAAVVGLLENHPTAAPIVQKIVPELQWA